MKLSQVKDYFTKKTSPKRVTKKEVKASPTNFRSAVQTVKDRKKKMQAMMAEMK